MRKYHQGIFVPKYPKKYRGNVKKIFYRSSWELRFMAYLDESPNVIAWASEEFHIPYENPIDGKQHRYFPDILFKMIDKNQKEITYLVEIKPDAQSREPVKRKQKQKTFIQEVATFGMNEAKWKAAKIYCAKRGWEFKVVTEKNTPWIVGK